MNKNAQIIKGVLVYIYMTRARGITTSKSNKLEH